MPLFVIYIVKQMLTGFIDSAWRAKLDAEVKASDLNENPLDIDKQFNLKWQVEKLEVL